MWYRKHPWWYLQLSVFKRQWSPRKWQYPGPILHPCHPWQALLTTWLVAKEMDLSSCIKCLKSSPGLNCIFTPASLWIFLIISPFRPITTPTEWRGTAICRIMYSVKSCYIICMIHWNIIVKNNGLHITVISHYFALKPITHINATTSHPWSVFITVSKTCMIPFS